MKEAEFIVSLMAKVAKSDGRVSELEAELIGVVLDDLTRDGAKRESLKELYNREKNSSTSAGKIALSYKISLNLSEEICINRVYFFLNLAYIDGEFNRAEKRVIGEICDGFGFSGVLRDEILTKFEESFGARFGYRNHAHYRDNTSQNSPTQKSPYEILGISESASFDEIRRAYKNLAKRYHPDILIGSGASDEIVQSGTKRLQEINEAYEILKEKFDK